MDRPYFEWQLTTDNEIALFKKLRLHLRAVSPDDSATRQLQLIVESFPELAVAAQADWVQPLIDDLDKRIIDSGSPEQDSDYATPLSDFTRDALRALNNNRPIYLPGQHLSLEHLPDAIKTAPHYRWLSVLVERLKELRQSFPTLRVVQRLTLLSAPPRLHIDDETLADLYMTYYRAEYQDVMSFECFASRFADTRDKALDDSGQFTDDFKARVLSTAATWAQSGTAYDDIIEWLMRNYEIHPAFQSQLMDLLDTVNLRKIS